MTKYTVIYRQPDYLALGAVKQAALDAATAQEVANEANEKAAASLAAPYQPFASRAAAQLAEVPVPLVGLEVGGLRYIRDPSGTALQTADGARWSPAGEATIRHWGAVGDGVADDTAAIESALLWVDASDNRRLSIPEGSYGLSRTVEFSAKGILIEGRGKSPFLFGADRKSVSRIFALPGFVGTVLFRFKAPTSGSNPGHTIRNVTLDGSQLDIDGLEFERYHQQLTVENVHILDVRTGVILGESCWGPTFKAVTCTHSRIGWDLRDKNHNAMFLHCVSRGFGTPISAARIGFVGNCANVSFIACDFETNGATSSEIHIIRSNGVSISGCYFEARAANNTIILGSSGETPTRIQGVSITGCYFNGRGDGLRAIYVVAAQGVDVSSCSIASYVTRAMTVDNGSDVVWRRTNILSGGTPEPTIQNSYGVVESAVLDGKYHRNQSLTMGAQVTWDTSNGHIGSLNINSAIDPNINAPTNLSIGDEVLIRITNNSGGDRLVTWDSDYGPTGFLPSILPTGSRFLCRFVKIGATTILRQDVEPVPWLRGAGAPEGAISAPVGSLYTRTDGSAGATLYVKESGGVGNTGWAAK